MKKFNLHKIRNFNEHGCYAEQHACFNILFTHAHINETSLESYLRLMWKNEKEVFSSKKFDTNAIEFLFTKHWKNFQDPTTAHIMTSRKQIATQFFF